MVVLIRYTTTSPLLPNSWGVKAYYYHASNNSRIANVPKQV